MNKSVLAFLVFMVLGTVGIVGYKLVKPTLDQRDMLDSSNSVKIKATITIGIDNWIGYYPLCSKQMKSRMRSAGYNLKCVDDKADYADRMQKLKDKEYQFAVATVDSYLSNGKKVDYPATILMAIDESKGGDAIVAWKDQVASIDALKKQKDYKIAFTPNSPSEHLLRGVADHFSVANLKNSKSWRVETDGATAALDKLMKKEVGVAVLWEPEVSKALENSQIVKILGTEDTKRLIVDILLVERSFAKENKEIVDILLTNYFRTLKQYQSNEQDFVSDIMAETKLGEEAVRNMLKGVSWVNLHDNATQWLGINRGNYKSEGMIDTIESTIDILKNNNVLKSNPLPNQDPLVVMNTSFVENLFTQGMTETVSEDSSSSEMKAFKELTVSQWGALREVGTLKIQPITFQSGTADLDEEGKEELRKAAKNLDHYPNFRIIAKGHTALGGDDEANYLLSEARSKAVVNFLVKEVSIDSNRLKAKGFGSSQPLAKDPSESDREYKYRLPRVELYLLKEVF